MLTLYSLLYTLGFIATLPLFLWKREKYLPGFSQRLGNLPEFNKSSEPVVWVHCVSVGEVNAAIPLVRALRSDYPEHRIVVSTVTKTGQDLAGEVFAEQADLVFYFPFDWGFSVRKSLRAIRPDLVLVLETEIWFNFFREVHRRGITLAIVNGRLSEKSMKGYLRIPGTIKRVLRHVDHVLAQSERDGKRYAKLGVRKKKITVTGNLKNDQPAEEGDDSKVSYFKERFSVSPKRPLILAASTHSPEERIVLEAFASLRERDGLGSARLMIAPRHPERFDEVWGIIRDSGFKAARRTGRLMIEDGEADVILLDSIGELRSVYALANLVFVGGSLIPHGGQNILEPALERKAIVTGPSMDNFAAIAERFEEAGAFSRLPEMKDEDRASKLESEFHRLLSDGALREELGTRAFEAASADRGATERTLRVLDPVLRIQSAQSAGLEPNLPQ